MREEGIGKWTTRALILAVAGFATFGPKLGFLEPKPENTTIGDRFKGKNINLTLSASSESRAQRVFQISGDEYTNLRNEPRDWTSQFETNRYQTRHHSIESVANWLFRELDDNAFGMIAGSAPADYERTLQFVAANVQYERDSGNGYLKHPIETLVEKTGDCEDMAGLVAALLMSGTDRKIARLYEPGSKDRDAHITLAVKLREGENAPYIVTTKHTGNSPREKCEKDVARDFDPNMRYEEAQRIFEKRCGNLPFAQQFVTQAATFNVKEGTYVAIEVTSTNKYHLKEFIVPGATMVPLN